MFFIHRLINKKEAVKKRKFLQPLLCCYGVKAFAPKFCDCVTEIHLQSGYTMSNKYKNRKEDKKYVYSQCKSK